MSTKPKPPAPTSAQLAIWHGLQSAFQAAVISICVAALQYLATGNINLSVLLTVLGSAFLGAGTMIYKSVSANPALAQAALDTANEALQRIEQIAPSWLSQGIQKPAPQTPITFPPAQQAKPAQQQSGGGGLPPDYYTRNYNVQTRASIQDMSTQGYPAVQQAQPQQQFTNTNQVPPAMSFLQQNQPQSAIEQLRNTQQGG